MPFYEPHGTTSRWIARLFLPTIMESYWICTRRWLWTMNSSCVRRANRTKSKPKSDHCGIGSKNRNATVKHTQCGHASIKPGTPLKTSKTKFPGPNLPPGLKHTDSNKTPIQPINQSGKFPRLAPSARTARDGFSKACANWADHKPNTTSPLATN